MEQPPRLPKKLVHLDLRVAESDRDAWREASVRAKQNLSEWVRVACDERLAREATKKR
jgi:hypothetical protein